MMYKTTDNFVENDINSILINKEIPARQWLHNIKHMTSNKLGTIFWKGVCIDVLKNSEDAENKPYVVELSQHCKHLEEINVPVNIKTVVFYWTWFCDMNPNHPYKKILSRCPDIRVAQDKILFTFDKAACECIKGNWEFKEIPKEDDANRQPIFYSELKRKGYKGVPLAQSDLDGLVSCFNRYKVPTSLMEIMANALNPRLNIQI